MTKLTWGSLAHTKKKLKRPNRDIMFKHGLAIEISINSLAFQFTTVSSYYDVIYVINVSTCALEEDVNNCNTVMLHEVNDAFYFTVLFQMRRY